MTLRTPRPKPKTRPGSDKDITTEITAKELKDLIDELGKLQRQKIVLLGVIDLDLKDEVISKHIKDLADNEKAIIAEHDKIAAKTADDITVKDIEDMIDKMPRKDLAKELDKVLKAPRPGIHPKPKNQSIVEYGMSIVKIWRETPIDRRAKLIPIDIAGTGQALYDYLKKCGLPVTRYIRKAKKDDRYN